MLHSKGPAGDKGDPVLRSDKGDPLKAQGGPENLFSKPGLKQQIPCQGACNRPAGGGALLRSREPTDKGGWSPLPAEELTRNKLKCL